MYKAKQFLFGGKGNEVIPDADSVTDVVKKESLLVKMTARGLLVLTAIDDFFDNVVEAELTQVMKSWITVISISELITYGLMDRFGKTDPVAQTGTWDKGFISGILLPFIFLGVTFLLKRFSSAV